MKIGIEYFMMPFTKVFCKILIKKYPIIAYSKIVYIFRVIIYNVCILNTRSVITPTEVNIARKIAYIKKTFKAFVFSFLRKNIQKIKGSTAVKNAILVSILMIRS